MTATLTTTEQRVTQHPTKEGTMTTTLKGVAGRFQTAATQAQAHVDAARAAKQAEWDSRGVLFEGKSRDEGRNATVTLYPDRIERVKERSRLSLSSARQDVEVTPMRSVSSVQAKKEGALLTKVTVYASGNNIDFRFFHPEARRFHEAITNLITTSQTGAPAPTPSREPDLIDQLKKLAELRDAGILTIGEFEAKKKQILGL